MNGNAVIALFLALGLILHWNPIRYVRTFTGSVLLVLLRGRLRRSSRLRHRFKLLQPALGIVGNLGCGADEHLVDERCELLADEPPRHRVHVGAHDIEAEPVGLLEGCSSPHEWVGDGTVEAVRTEVGVGHGEIVSDELREQQVPGQRARAACEPFVDADVRAKVLLCLLLPERHARGESRVEPVF